MDGRLLRLTFPPALISEPVVYQMGKQFGLVPNIRRANIARDTGWVILELEGEDEQVRRAVRWVLERGVLVESVEGELLD